MNAPPGALKDELFVSATEPSPVRPIEQARSGDLALADDLAERTEARHLVASHQFVGLEPGTLWIMINTVERWLVRLHRRGPRPAETGRAGFRSDAGCSASSMVP